MAGRGRLPRRPDDAPPLFREGPPPAMPRRRGPVPIRALEEEHAMQRDEIQRLLADNRHLFEENVALKREVGAVKEEIHNLGQVIPRLRADKEAQARELIQRGLKLEADLRNSEPLKAEVLHLQNEARKLETRRQEMLAKIQGLSKDLKRLQAENEQIPNLRGDIDALRKELVKTRTAYEYEKEANADKLQQRDAMEKNVVSMARELEKLRAEHEARARGPASAYPGPFRDGYGGGNGLYGAWGSYNPQGFPRH